uniref:F-box and WD-40 domain-containing protein CDC4 n=1 Tax=Kwoniella dejecticola CBS 10117 TaxID=1296121 RepID=A0A1A5ZVC9_9TREE|nr:F-box and WD-40 domain-containing protein CDC4 [Kwoniella dejecticola CBS 10117]OBR81769.1 F-box and WD-40 domain-containing protein CDC4 [Kwoniella dejecticola CBS 10117]
MDYNDPYTPSNRGPLTAGLSWQNGIPSLRMEDAVVETVVTHTTRTTTSFAPIVLPRIPPPDTLDLPTHLRQEQFPLAKQPAPPEMQFFTLNLGGRRVVVQDDIAVPINADGSMQASGPGWTKRLPACTYDPSSRAGQSSHTTEERTTFLQAMEKAKGKEVRKRPHSFSRPSSRQDEESNILANTPPISASDQLAIRQRSPPRKKIRGMEELSIIPQTGNSALLSPLPSPEHEAGPSTPTSTTSPVSPNLGSGVEVAALLSLPTLASQFDQLPERLQQHFLMHLLRRSRRPTIQRVSAFAANALKRDFITMLPHEVAVQVLRKVDRPSLAVASRVCKKWKRMIDTERVVWQQRLVDDDLWYGLGVEEAEERKILERYETLDWKAEREAESSGHAWSFRRDDTPSDDERMLSATASNPARMMHEEVFRPTPLKHVYRRRYQDEKNWLYTRPEHTSFSGDGTNVVTCLQFDEEKIISASDDHSINVHNTRGGNLMKRLDGHDGGVWTLEYKNDVMVSGSTDRTVRIWDLDEMAEVHVFNGHTSTVRCLQMVEPVWNEKEKVWQPPYPMIVTGSRDATLRVWKLPGKDDPPYIGVVTEQQAAPPEENPYYLHLLQGHSSAVRALAAHGNICISGSYDMTVRVWDIVKGTCVHVLTGHEAKVYSIVYDQYRGRCASGSMDNTVKVWDVNTGDCLHTLHGHTSLVGLLGISPNYLVSAAADASLRVWDTETLEAKTVLSSHGGAITCFQHDETKVVSGSDGALKLWDIKTGTYIRDLVVGISSVWQVAFNGNLLVAASNRGGQTVFDVFDFCPNDARNLAVESVDDDSLDTLRVPLWQKDLPKRISTKKKKKRSTRYSRMDEDLDSLFSDDDVGKSPTLASYNTHTTTTPLDRWGRSVTSPSRKAQYGESGQASASTAGNRRSTRIASRTSFPSQSDPSPSTSANTRRLSQHQYQQHYQDPSQAQSQHHHPPAFAQPHPTSHLSFAASPSYQHASSSTSAIALAAPGDTRTRLRKLRSTRETNSPSPAGMSTYDHTNANTSGHGNRNGNGSSRLRSHVDSTTSAAVSAANSSFAPIFDDEGVIVLDDSDDSVGQDGTDVEGDMAVDSEEEEEEDH